MRHCPVCDCEITVEVSNALGCCVDCEANTPNPFDDVEFAPEWPDETEHDDPTVVDEPVDMTDVEADADTLRSVGWGTDEDYGYYGQDEYYPESDFGYDEG